jgi:hypothetical protein
LGASRRLRLTPEAAGPGYPLQFLLRPAPQKFRSYPWRVAVRRIRSAGLVILRILRHSTAINFMGSMFNKFIDLRNNSLGTFYMEHIMKPDNETGNFMPVKQIENFSA